jgi:hypothetical protein
MGALASLVSILSSALRELFISLTAFEMHHASLLLSMVMTRMSTREAKQSDECALESSTVQQSIGSISGNSCAVISSAVEKG